MPTKAFQWQQMRVLRFLRGFAKVSTQDLADASDYLTLETVEKIDNDLCDLDGELISEYAQALQKLIGTKSNLTTVAEKAARDPELLALMDDYDHHDKHSFMKTFRIAQKIIKISEG